MSGFLEQLCCVVSLAALRRCRSMIPSGADEMEKRQESRYRYAMEQPIRLERDAIDFAVIESDSYGLYEEAVARKSVFTVSRLWPVVQWSWFEVGSDSFATATTLC